MLLSFWTSKRLLIGFIIPYCHLKLNCYGMTGLKGDSGSGHTLVVVHSCAVNNCKLGRHLSQVVHVPLTILGPLLFLFYINDLPNCLRHSQVKIYTNNTSITYAGSDVNNNINEQLNYDLNKIYVWLGVNKTLNIKKTEFFLIGSRQRLSNVSDKPSIVVINDTLVKQVLVSKSLV